MPAPPGTETWPGYPFDGLSSINARCLGTSYKGALYPDGTLWWKKEVSHTEGYTARQAEASVAGGMPKDAWFGFKIVMRNSGGGNVHVETWVDSEADGHWVRLTDADDDGWPAGNAHIDGCADAPFGYSPSDRLTWAGPNAAFRWDNIAGDIKWPSVREIAPLR